MASSREELRFDLTGRDVSASRTLRDVADQARRTDEQLDEVGGERDVDIRVDTEGSDLDAVRRDLDRLSGEVTARIRVEVSPPGALEELRADLDRVAGEVTARIRIEESGSSLADLRAELERLNGTTTARVRIEITPPGALEEFRSDLDRVAGEVTARVRIEESGTSLTDLRAELDRAARDVTARVRVEFSPGDAAIVLRELRNDLQWFSGRNVTTRLNVTGVDTASRRLADLSRDWAWFDARGPLRLEIDVDIDSIAEVELLHELLERVDGTYTARINVDQSGGSSLRQTADDAGRLSGMLDGLRGRASSAATGLLGLGASAVKLAAGAAAAVDVGVHLAQWIGQMAPAAALAAPAILTMAQGMGVLKLALGDMKKTWPEMYRELQTFKKGLQETAQQGISDGLHKALRTLQADMPIVQEGVRRTSEALGWLANEAATAFSGPAFRGELATIVNGNATAVWRLGDAGISAAKAFFDIAAAAEPAFLNLTALVQVGARQISQWVGMKAASGDLATSIQKGADSVGTFLSALFLFGQGAHSIFSALKTDSTDLSTSIWNVASAFNSWATSETTINRIKADIAQIKIVVGEAVTALRQGFYGQAADETTGWPGLVAHFGQTLRELADFVTQQVVPTLTALSSLLTGQFGAALLSVLDIVHQLVLSGLTTLLQIVRDDLVPLLRDHVAPLLNDVVIPAFRDLSDWCEQHLFPAVKSVADTLRDQLGPALDHIRQTIEDNKPQLDAFATGLLALGTVIVDLATVAIELNLINSLKAMVLAIDAVIQIISDLMVIAAQLAVAMLQAFAEITLGFKAIFDAAAETVSGIISVFATLPGPLGEPFRQAQGDVDAFKTKIDGDMDAAAGKARDTAASINGWLAGIQDKTVTVTIQQRVEFDAAFASVEGLANAGRASGGPVVAGTTYWVGEQGPELFTPNVGGSITDAITSKAITSHQNDVYDGSLARASRAAAGGWDGAAAPVVVNNYINVNAGVIATPSERRKLAEAIADSITDVQVNRRGSNARVAR